MGFSIVARLCDFFVIGNASWHGEGTLPGRSDPAEDHPSGVPTTPKISLQQFWPHLLFL